MRFEFQEGIGMAIRKEVLRRRGALASAATRAPAGGARRADAAGARSRADVGDDAQKGTGMDFGLKGKVAMVARREPRARLRGRGGAGARRRAGLDVVAATRRRSTRRAKRISSAGATVLGTVVDVRNGDQHRRLGGRRPIERFGGIDLLFTNWRRSAGRRRPSRSTMRRGRTRSTCCCSARSAWCAPRCRR